MLAKAKTFLFICFLYLGTFGIVSSHSLAEVNKTTQSFWASLFGVIFSILPMLAVEKPLLPTSADKWIYLFVHSLSVSLLNILAIIAVSTIGPLVVSILLPLYLVFMYILQITWLRCVNPGRNNFEELVGIFVILVVSMTMPLCDLCFQKQDCVNKQGEDYAKMKDKQYLLK